MGFALQVMSRLNCKSWPPPLSYRPSDRSQLVQTTVSSSESSTRRTSDVIALPTSRSTVSLRASQVSYIFRPFIVVGAADLVIFHSQPTCLSERASPSTFTTTRAPHLSPTLPVPILCVLLLGRSPWTTFSCVGHLGVRPFRFADHFPFQYVYHRSCHEIDSLWFIHQHHHTTKHPTAILA